MKRYVSIAAAAVALPLALISMTSADDQQTAPQPCPPPGVAVVMPTTNPATDPDFHQELVKARAQIDQLQQELNDLRQTLDRLQRSQPASQYLIRVTPPPAGRQPPNGVPRQFDGTTYYIVPLQSGSPATMPSK